MSGSFELKFFHPPEQVVGKDGKNVTKRRCRFCGTLASEHNERRRNHLKDADDGCDRNFKLANGGLSFKEYVMRTQPQPIIDRLYPGYSRSFFYEGVASPASATGRSSTPLVAGGGGGSGGGGFIGDPGQLHGHLGGRVGDPLGSDPSCATPPPLPSVPTPLAGVPAPAQPDIHRHFRQVPKQAEGDRFQMLLTECLCANAYAANSLQHPTWTALVEFLWPGMGRFIPSPNTML